MISTKTFATAICLTASTLLLTATSQGQSNERMHKVIHMSDEVQYLRSLVDEYQYRDSIKTEIIAAQVKTIENDKAIISNAETVIDDISKDIHRCRNDLDKARRHKQMLHTAVVLLAVCVPSAYGLGSLVEQLR